MPGISLIFDFEKEVIELESSFFNSLDSVLHSEQFTKRILDRGRNFILAATGYENYSIKTFTGKEFHFTIEGYIYNKSRKLLEQELIELAEAIFRDREKGKRLLREWLPGVDGEFIVCIRNARTEEIIIFNDLLGHLPIYYTRKNNYLLISREIGVFQKFLSPTPLDRMGIAQYLIFSFTLGERTLFENVKRLKQGAILVISHQFHDAIVESLIKLNFEEKLHSRLSLNENIDASIELFEKACRNRAEECSPGRTLLSLSGGLDSRTVGAGLKRAGVPFEGITFLDYRGKSMLDVKIAEQTAKAFGVNWRKVDLPMPRGSDAYTVLQVKSGLNYFGMKFIIPYYREMQSLFGTNFSHFNGNTGMILRDYRAARKLVSLDDTVSYIFSKGGKYLMMGLFSTGEAARFTGIVESEILEEIRQLILDYPEQSFEQKYVHFVFSGYCFNWHYEGIDMQRFFFWTHTPLESTPCFLYVMNCPDIQKQYYTFYREFITRISPETADIHNASWNSSINSKQKFLNFVLRSYYNKMPSAVKTVMRQIFRRPVPYNPDSMMMKCFQEQILACPSIGEYLEPKLLSETALKCSQREFDILFTLTSLIEYASTGKSTLLKYNDEPFE
jgi:asparagine synthase (glutamine-hydrolysing)